MDSPAADVADKFNTGEQFNADLVPEYYAPPTQETKKTTSHPFMREKSFRYEQVDQEMLENMKQRS